MITRFTKALAAAAIALSAMAAAAAPLRTFDSGSMDQIAAARKGKPFVVVVWSLDCEFCRESLDTLARLRKQRPTLDVVTVSTDPASDDVLAKLSRERLAHLGLDNDAWAFGDEAPERLRYALDRKWHGEKPRSYWFSASGARTAYSGVITPEVVDKYFAR